MAARHLRWHHADQRQRRCSDYTAKTPSRSTTSRTWRCTRTPVRYNPTCRKRARRPASCSRTTSSTPRSGRALDCGSGQRGADARPHHERIRAGCRHELGHRLGRDDADEAFLRRQRHRHAVAPVPAQLQQDRRCVRRRRPEHLRSRRKHDVDAARLLAAAAVAVERAVLGSERHHVQQLERAGLGERRQHPDDASRTAGSTSASSRARSRAPIHTLPNDDTIVTDIFANSSVGAATYVGLPVVGFAVQSFTNGVTHVNAVNVLSNYGGNFVQKGTRRIDAALP